MTEEARPYRVLVVCTGNTCRTPMAEALLRRMFDEHGIEAEVRSAGTHAIEGGPAHPLSVDVAAEAGLDLDGFRASQLTTGRVRWADTVLGMQRAHVDRVLELDDTVDAHVLTEFASDEGPAPSPGRGIEDPIGRERAVYERVFEQIRTCLEAFVDRTRSAAGGGGSGAGG